MYLSSFPQLFAEEIIVAKACVESAEVRKETDQRQRYASIISSGAACLFGLAPSTPGMDHPNIAILVENRHP